jgi:GNAT superfamily N-acetyltransferase
MLAAAWDDRDPGNRILWWAAVMGIRTAYLADHPEALPRLQEWVEAEWPAWYGPGGPGDAAEDLRAYCGRDVLPIGIVGFEGDELVGLMALKPTSDAIHPGLGPWAAAGFVRPDARGRGVGATLLRALEDVARGLGLARIYSGTATSATLLERAGWRHLEHVDVHGEPVAIYEKVLQSE